MPKKQEASVLFRAQKRRRLWPIADQHAPVPLPVNGKLPVPLPAEDNTPEGLQALLAANRYFRERPWPEPFTKTTHRLHGGDARDLAGIPDSSVHLVVTSPPYWT